MTHAVTPIGHRETWDFLQRLIENERFPASLLLVGPPSIGKSTIAEAAALRLLAAEGSRLEAHPDLLHIEPQEDLAMRGTLVKLLGAVHEHPVRAPTRVILLKGVDRLSPDAASLLLKAVEDGPRFAKFILTAKTRDLVSETIRSRSFVVELKPVPAEELLNGLAERGYPKKEASTIARLAGGRPGLALRLLADSDLRTRYERWETLLSPGDLPFRERSNAAAALDSPEAAEEFLCFLQSRLRDGSGSPMLLRRSREAIAMVRQHVPARLVIEYVLA